MKCNKCGKQVYESRTDRAAWCNNCNAVYFAGVFLEIRNSPLTARGLIVRKNGEIFDFEQNKKRDELKKILFDNIANIDLLVFVKEWWDSLSMESKINIYKDKARRQETNGVMDGTG